MNNKDFEVLSARIKEFAQKRGWIKFHNPKNLAMAIAGEAGELAAEFQWLTHEESTATNLTPNQAEKIRLEIADILIYLLRLSDELGVDVVESVLAKMAINEERFPLNQKG